MLRCFTLSRRASVAPDVEGELTASSPSHVLHRALLAKTSELEFERLRCIRLTDELRKEYEEKMRLADMFFAGLYDTSYERRRRSDKEEELRLLEQQARDASAKMAAMETRLAHLCDENAHLAYKNGVLQSRIEVLGVSMADAVGLLNHYHNPGQLGQAMQAEESYRREYESMEELRDRLEALQETYALCKEEHKASLKEVEGRLELTLREYALCKEEHKALLEKMARELTCSLTLEMFQEPVATATGMVYEETALYTWFRTTYRCPLTRVALTPAHVVRCPRVKALCELVRHALAK